MTKFFYVFLLSLLILSGKYQLEALFLDPQTLDKLYFKIEDSDLNDFKNFSKYLRTGEPAEVKSVTPENKVKRYIVYWDRVNNPLIGISSGNFDYAVPENSAEVSDTNPNLNIKGKNSMKHKIMWLSAQEPIDVTGIRATMKKWSLHDSRRKKASEEDIISSDLSAPVTYVDYTNSQMPFNEGRTHQKKLLGKTREASKKKNAFGFETFNASKKRKISEKPLRRRRLEIPVRSKNVEFLRDDSLLEYSRVRRFLDHKRAKKQIRMSSTLEAKEAAMSRVLDPNLDSDGMLEPHVRKRRGLCSGKHNLSNSRCMKKSRSKRQKPTFRFKRRIGND